MSGARPDVAPPACRLDAALRHNRSSAPVASQQTTLCEDQVGCSTGGHRRTQRLSTTSSAMPKATQAGPGAPAHPAPRFQRTRLSTTADGFWRRSPLATRLPSPLDARGAHHRESPLLSAGIALSCNRLTTRAEVVAGCVEVESSGTSWLSQQNLRRGHDDSVRWYRCKAPLPNGASRSRALYWSGVLYRREGP